MTLFSRNNLLRKKYAAYIINLDDKKSKGTHQASLFPDINTADSFGIEYIPQVVLSKIRHKSIKPNIFGIKDNESDMCGFYCIVFI